MAAAKILPIETPAPAAVPAWVRNMERRAYRHLRQWQRERVDALNAKVLRGEFAAVPALERRWRWLYETQRFARLWDEFEGLV